MESEIQIDIRLLRKTVRKWSLIAVGLGTDRGVENCALCSKYWVGFGADRRSCVQCPIKLNVNQVGCRGTPYFAYKQWKGWDVQKPDVGYMRTLANKELMFLQKILEAYIAAQKFIEEEVG